MSIGGLSTEFGKFADCVALWNPSVGLVGSGVLISQDVVATAGHVLQAGVERVGVGPTIDALMDFDSVRTGENRKDFNPHTLEHDLALVFLRSGFEQIATRPIATGSIVSQMQECSSVGYGSNERNRASGKGVRRSLSYPEGVRHLWHSVVGLQVCTPAVGWKVHLGDDSHAICEGDSGGPLYTSWNGELLTVGIASDHGDVTGACRGGSVFLRLDRYSFWINDVVKQHQGFPPVFR